MKLRAMTRAGRSVGDAHALRLAVIVFAVTSIGGCTMGRDSQTRRAEPEPRAGVQDGSEEEGAVIQDDGSVRKESADDASEEKTSDLGARYTTEMDLTNVVGDWIRASELPSTARFEYPERLEIREGGIYLIPQTEIYEHAPLWQGGAIEAVDGEPDRIRLQSANDAMLEYDWSLGDDALTFVVEDDLEIVYRRMREGR